MKLIKRHVQSRILRLLEAFPVVYINGPRQSGKTTLVRELLTDGFMSSFVTFDDMLERSAAMRNPYSYIKGSDCPLIIDEVQMVPEVFRPLKKLVDEARQRSLHEGTSANGSYLLTGSANLLAIPQLADAMVGRMASVTLLPLSVAEVNGKNADFFGRCFAKDFSHIDALDGELTDIIARASFPEFLNMPEDMIDSWLGSYIQKVTLEDPKYIYNLERAQYMPLLLQILATRAGSLVNDAAIGREIGLNAVTTRSYRNLLASMFVIHQLKPWYRNVGKRLVKSGKMFFYDSLLLCYLLQSNIKDIAKNQPNKFGHILENFVLTELLKNNNITGAKVDISFYRTSDGREVDFVLEKQGKLVAIEVKNAEHIADKDVAGIRDLRQSVGQDFCCGIVLCNTQRVITYDEDIYLLPFSALF